VSAAEVSLPPLPEVPLVSVLSLTYNHERFIAESVESVLAQDWPADRLQYVVLNDGSTDGTARALDPYRDDPRVTVIDQENKGLLGALRTVLDLMTGDVICGCAGDDAMKPGRIARLVRALQEHPEAGIAYSDMELVDATGSVLSPSFLDQFRSPRVSGRIRGSLIARNVVPGAGVMMRGCLKPLFHPAPAHVAWEDYWWAWAIAGVSDVVHVPEALYRYRYHGDNMSLGVSGERLATAMSQELQFRRFMHADVGEGEATAQELLTGIVSMWQLANVASEEGRQGLTPSGQARSEARVWLERAVAAEAAGDCDGAALACCRAASLHPLDPTLVAVVKELLHVVVGAPAPDGARAVLDELGARRFTVLVDAGLLVGRPELLRAYGQAFGADDDATLVIHADGADWERLSAAVPRLVADSGLDGDAAPDMVFTTESAERLRAIGAAADAVLGADLFGTGQTPFGAADCDGLRLIAQRTWASAGAAS
jgi:glycosyltransferase involved in cell wall biosynthesis